MYLEYDGRDVPDVATIVADYDEGCQLIITATMINDYPIGEVIRGRLATIKFVKGGFEVIEDDAAGQRRRHPGPAGGEPSRAEFVELQDRRRPATPTRRRCGRTSWSASGRATARRSARRSWGRRRSRRWHMGVQSYRQGKVLFWDKEQRKPIEADAQLGGAAGRRAARSTASRTRSSAGTPATRAASLEPPDYQKLAGPWIDGKDPARA